MRIAAERRTMISKAPLPTLRLRLHPAASPGSPRTALDGAWWPRSADPVAELPALVLALQDHGPIDDHSPITHVLLRVGDWDGRPRRLWIDGPADTRVVRLSWFDSLPAGLLTAIHADGRRVDLLTVPVSTARAEAEAAMEPASHPAGHPHTPGLPAALTISDPRRLDEVRMPAYRRPGHTIVGLSGALDAAAAPALREHLISALRHSARLLILDLSEVASADVTGLAVLAGIQRRAAGLGVTLCLAAPGPQVTALLHVTGLERVLTVQHARDFHTELAA
ncbi:STAS domain-containing protein [Actinomadura harenae]|uniref:Anti-sigma factor antagonist n=1 Tax=Actinomadura harenae TaxID=2483351 RepID=A0A3M2MDJ3_9ACTN|nr:STAS domain-containing protein [Actinomadura harenae]RMI45278.1 anti-sigma factor antagonist [Actinomadura harenae]